VIEDFTRKPTYSAVWFGDCLQSQGTLGTDKLFTGQRLDETGLYYYNARYYDATIGRFISPDTIVPDFANPQTLNRYSYCISNPLKLVDPSGHDPEWYGEQYGFEYYCAIYEYICNIFDIRPIGQDGRDVMDKVFELYSPKPAEPDSNIPDTMNVVWGYSETRGFLVVWHKSTIVATDGKGNFYEISTKGWGGGLYVSFVTQELTEKGTITPDMWNVGIKTGFGLGDVDWSGSIGIGSDGFYAEGPGETIYAGFGDPTFEIYGTGATIRKISAAEIFYNTPLNIVQSHWGLDYFLR
jgi:RHS repeat-associated protein